jgi:hypothetical protein
MDCNCQLNVYCAAPGLVYNTEACAAHERFHTLGPELHLDMSTPMGPKLHLGVSTPQRPVLLLDMTGQQVPEMLLDLSAQMRP